MTWVSIDGLEGAGKTTLVEGLKSRLPELHILPEFSESFSGRALASAVKKKPHRISGSAVAQSLFFLAEFIEKIEEARHYIDNPHCMVLSDRGTFSKMVYQNVILEPIIGCERTSAILSSSLSCLPSPDSTIWLYVHPEVAKQRMEYRGDGETIDLDFMKAAADEFDRLADQFSVQRFDTTNRTASDLCDCILAYLVEMFDTIEP